MTQLKEMNRILEIQKNYLETEYDQEERFTESLNTAYKILEADQSGVPHILVNAPMQSGKTSVMIEFQWLKLIQDGGELKSFFNYFCNISDNQIREQTRERVEKFFGTRFNHVTDVTHRSSIKKQVKNHLKSINDFCLENYYLFIDECHTNDPQEGQVEKYISGLKEELENFGIKLVIIHVSATHTTTNAANILRKRSGKKEYPLINHTPGEGYVGLEELKDCIEPLEAPMSQWVVSSDELNPQIQEAVDSIKKGEIGLFRIWGADCDNFKYVLEEKGVGDVKVFDAKNFDDFQNAADENRNLSKPNYYMIKGKLTAGQTIINKSNIKVVVESYKNNTPAVVQGLPGRMCGYTPVHPELKIYCSSNKVDTYLNYLKFPKIALDSKGNNLSESKTFGAWTFEYVEVESFEPKYLESIGIGGHHHNMVRLDSKERWDKASFQAFKIAKEHFIWEDGKLYLPPQMKVLNRGAKEVYLVLPGFHKLNDKPKFTPIYKQFVSIFGDCVVVKQSFTKKVIPCYTEHLLKPKFRNPF